MIEQLRILYMKMNQFKHFLERQLPSQKSLVITFCQPVATQTLALTPKSANVTLHLSSEAMQSSLLESELWL